MYFYVFYQVRGSRCSGSYFVQADNKRQAKSKVKALDPDYCHIQVMTVEEGADEFSYDEEDEVLNREEYIREMVDGIYHIESGT